MVTEMQARVAELSAKLESARQLMCEKDAELKDKERQRQAAKERAECPVCFDAVVDCRCAFLVASCDSLCYAVCNAATCSVQTALRKSIVTPPAALLSLAA